MSSHEALAQQLYVSYYGRPGDPAGVAFWTAQFADAANLDAAVEAFGSSAEYTALSDGMTNTQLVTSLYQQMFGRDPEQEGLDFWLAFPARLFSR